MNAGLFDTLKYARRLQQAGFTPDQADGATEALAAAYSDEIATKADLRDLRAELRDDIAKLAGEVAKLSGEVAKLGGDLRTEISILRADTAKWIIGAVFVNFAGILGAIALVWQLARR